MLKKVFALLIAVTLIFITSNVFAANNEIGDSMNKAGNTVRNVVGGAENVVEDAAGAIGTGVGDIGNAVSDGVEGMTNDGNNNGVGYNATRTTARTTTGTTNGTFLGMSANTWTWFVLAIAAIAIVGLVWYYAMQNKTEYNNNNH